MIGMCVAVKDLVGLRMALDDVGHPMWSLREKRERARNIPLCPGGREGGNVRLDNAVVELWGFMDEEGFLRRVLGEQTRSSASRSAGAHGREGRAQNLADVHFGGGADDVDFDVWTRCGGGKPAEKPGVLQGKLRAVEEREGERAHDIVVLDEADVCHAGLENVGCIIEGKSGALDADDGGVPGCGCVGGGEGAQEGDGLREGVCAGVIW